MDKFLNGMKEYNNYALTENGAITHKSTLNGLMDLFAMGAAYRNRSEEDCILLFAKAFQENEILALRCLFYLRDITQGQGERRFFRTIARWLAIYHRDVIRRNLAHIVTMGRWDDLYTFVDTPLEEDAFKLIKKQLKLDIESKTPSLLGKWLKSENCSSKESRKLGTKTREYLRLTSKQYRKVLSELRGRIRVLEKLMSEGRWNEIEFDAVPSRAGFIYRNAFARHDIVKERYAKFALDKETKVNAKALYPYECVAEAFRYYGEDPVKRAMINKYWDNLTDYIKNAVFDGIAVVDVSGSMIGTPMNVAVSLGMYCAEKARGPYHNHFITFSDEPALIEIQGIDFVDKVRRMERADWAMSTNVEATFDMLLTTALKTGCSQDEIPQNVIIISDMEFNDCETSARYNDRNNFNTLFETMEKKWQAHGYELPRLVFWNVDARSNNIPMRDNGRVSYVSGFSPVLFEQIMQNKSGFDLMMDKLNSDRYKEIK